MMKTDGATVSELPRAAYVAPPAELVDATKIFGGTFALDTVSFPLHAGEVLALLGENGAGKSTCVKLLAGVYRPDKGQVRIGGEAVELKSPTDARRLGIGVMHQHPGLFPDLSVAENIFIGHYPLSPLGLLDEKTIHERAASLLDTVGLTCSTTTRLADLRTSEQQLVEIARALSTDARVLIMDEPTAALSQREVEKLFSVVKDLRSRQVAIMFVSHRMDEIFRVADRIAVLRDGKLVGVERKRELSRERAIEMMVGRPLAAVYPFRSAKAGDIVLTVEGLGQGADFHDVSFEVRQGEIVGLGGLVGSGRTEVARAIFGVTPATEGKMVLGGKAFRPTSPSDAMAAGIAYVSEDRLGQSLVMDFPILANASLPVVGQATFAGLVWRKRELALVEPQLKRLKLRFRSYDQPVNTLSGGNQQKVVLSKWLATRPRLLILDEPTQGIDVQTKAEVHAMMAQLAAHGMAILLISSELPELIGMCDRILVLHEGEVAATFEQREANQTSIMRAATGSGEIGMQTTGAAGTVSHSEWTLKPASFPQQVLKHRALGLAAAIALVLLPIAALNPRIFSAANLIAVGMDAGLLLIAAIGQMLIVLTRNIDLSIASTIGLTAYGAAAFIHAFPHAPPLAGIGVGCLLGLGCGLINGMVVTRGRVPSIVVTLGTLSIYRGLTSLWAGGRQISADQVPQSWLDMTSASFFGIPAVVLIAVAAAAVAALALRRLPWGRELFAIGSNPDGAVLAGLFPATLTLVAFVLAGMLAGLDGALWASRYATIDARVATGYELTVIASVVVGGVAIRGGSGTVAGVVLGCLTLLVIRNGLTLVRVDPLWLQGVYGLVILVAIAVDAFVARQSVAPRRVRS